MSTVEAEYMACSEAAREAQWLKQIESDIASTTQSELLTIKCDNQGTIKDIISGTSKARTKHIDVRYHNYRDLRGQGNPRFHLCPHKRQCCGYHGESAIGREVPQVHGAHGATVGSEIILLFFIFIFFVLQSFVFSVFLSKSCTAPMRR